MLIIKEFETVFQELVDQVEPCYVRGCFIHWRCIVTSSHFSFARKFRGQASIIQVLDDLVPHFYLQVQATPASKSQVTFYKCSILVVLCTSTRTCMYKGSAHEGFWQHNINDSNSYTMWNWVVNVGFLLFWPWPLRVRAVGYPSFAWPRPASHIWGQDKSLLGIFQAQP